MKRFIKTISFVMSAVMLLTMASCSTGKNKNEVRYVQETDPWYSDTIISVPQLTGDSSDRSMTGLKYADSEDIIVKRVIIRDDCTDMELIRYDLMGNQTATIEMNGVFDGMLQYFFKLGDEFYITGFKYDDNCYGLECIIARLDFDTGSYEINPADDFKKAMEENEGFANENLCCTIGDSLYGIKYSPSAGSYELVTADASWNTKTYSFADALGTDPAEYVFRIWNIDGMPVVACFSNRGNKLLELDKASGRLNAKAMSDQMASYADIWGGGLHNYDGSVYSFVDYELNKLDYETGESTHLMDLNECNVNRNLFDSDMIQPAYIDEDTIIFCPNEDIQGYSDLQIFVLKREPNNPNAGKVILDCAVLGLDSMDYCKAEVIRLFNESSTDSIIQIDKRYITQIYKPDGDTDMDDYYAFYRQQRSQINQSLLIDTLEGNGPDLIIGGFDSTEINNDACFIDLMPYFSKLNEDDYFMNVINAAKTGKELYQITLSFYLSGLDISSEIWDSYTGPTFSEYEGIVSECLDGYDPLSWNYSQTDFFITAFRSQSSLFIQDGRIDLSSSEFRALAEYCKDNFAEESGWYLYSREASNSDFAKTNKIMDSLGLQVSGYGLPDGSSAYEGTVYKTGFPSLGGSTPAFTCGDSCFSAGITAASASPDLCWEFIRFALSYEGQTCGIDHEPNNSVPIRKDALTPRAKAYNSSAVKMYEYNLAMMPDGLVGIATDPVVRELTEEEIESFKISIEAITDSARIDSDIEIILREEMKPYFKGDKTLDEIIPIIEDRVSTVLAER